MFCWPLIQGTARRPCLCLEDSKLGSPEGLPAIENVSRRLMRVAGLRVLGMSGLNSVPCLSSHGILDGLSICGWGQPQ